MAQTDVIVVGGGAAGLSAALFTAKNGLETLVFDTDETWLHHAHLFNYLGIRSQDGEAFLEEAREHATEDHGADLHQDEEVTAVEQSDDGFVVTTDSDEYSSRYLVLATGADRELADALGCAFGENGTVEVDVTMETSIAGAYATGAMVREEEWQAIISAGDGAAAALNILSTEHDEPFHDFDTPDDA